MPGPKRMSRASAGSRFDVANGISPDERYVSVATGRDYRDATPVSGIRLGQAEEQLAVTHHRGAVIQGKIAAGREFDDLLRRPEDRSRARVHVGHPHQCRHRFHLDLQKMHVWEEPGERVIVLMSAGNLATTQAVVSLLDERTKAVADRYADAA